jgi:oligoendopeptidase F
MVATAAAATPAPPKRAFVPADLVVTDFACLEPLYRALLDRPIDSPDDLGRWLRDFSELTSVVDEHGSRLYIDKSCHTDDTAIEQRYLHFVEHVEPKIKPLYFQLQKRYLESSHRDPLERTDRKLQILGRRWRADVELFRDENVPLETEITKLNNEYDKICGAMTVTFRGAEYTMQQLARFLEKPDRPTREEAWRLSAERRMRERESIEAIFDQQLPLRQTIARNAGLGDYRAFVWKSYKRFDYSPDDCLRFADAIATTCVPLVDELDRQRRQDLGLERLRPWDLSVDPKNRPPLEPFRESEVPAFVEKTRVIFERMSPQLAGDFDSLRRRNNLDLASRRGKQPGGYQCSLEEAREPFIFMNAAGLQRDVETLLHEGGHAFHCLAARDEDLVFVRSAPMEFCEVASMSMELLGSDHFDVFYNAADAARAKRTLMEGIIRFLPWMATIDSFQHWLYTNACHTNEQRTAEWLRLLERFGSKVDWSGLEEIRASQWQRQLHLFHAPFYYIEYGIAQLGALQLWMKSRENPQQALANYRAALKLGGTRPLPELFAAAGIRFDFSERTLGPLMDALGDELASLPR